MAEGLRHIQADVSDSTLSTAGGLGLEDLAAFVSQNSNTGQHRLQRPLLHASTSSPEHESIEAVAVDDSPLSRNIEMLDTTPVTSQFAVVPEEAAGDDGTYGKQDAQEDKDSPRYADIVERPPYIDVTGHQSPFLDTPGESSVHEAVSSLATLVAQSATAMALSSNPRDAPGPGQAPRSYAITEKDKRSDRRPATIALGNGSDEEDSAKPVIASLVTLDVHSVPSMTLSENLDVVLEGAEQAARSPAVNGTDKLFERHPDDFLGHGIDEEDPVQAVISSLATVLVHSATKMALSNNHFIIAADPGQLARSRATTEKKVNAELHADIELDTGFRQGAQLDAWQRSHDENITNGQPLMAMTLQPPPTDGGETKPLRGETKSRGHQHARRTAETKLRTPSAQFEEDTGSTTSAASLDTSTTDTHLSPLAPGSYSLESRNESAGDLGTPMAVAMNPPRREKIEDTSSGESDNQKYVTPSVAAGHRTSFGVTKQIPQDEGNRPECGSITKDVSSVFAVFGDETTTNSVFADASVNPHGQDNSINDGRCDVEGVSAMASGGHRNQAGGIACDGGKTQAGVRVSGAHPIQAGVTASGAHQTRTETVIDSSCDKKPIASAPPSLLDMIGKSGQSDVRTVTDGGNIELLAGAELLSPDVIGLEELSQTASAWDMVDKSGQSEVQTATETRQSELLTGADVSSPGVIGFEEISQAASAWVQLDVIGPTMATVANAGVDTESAPGEPFSSSWSTAAEARVFPGVQIRRSWSTTGATQLTQEEPINSSYNKPAATQRTQTLPITSSLDAAAKQLPPGLSISSSSNTTVPTPSIPKVPISNNSLNIAADLTSEQKEPRSHRCEHENAYLGVENATNAGRGHRERDAPCTNDRAWNWADAGSAVGTEADIAGATQRLPRREGGWGTYARSSSTHGAPSRDGCQGLHPSRLFHLLWQRDRLRCSFSQCSIPDTVVFDSMGEAVDWFFTSQRESCVKRKLTSNTRLSNIFQEFSKGCTAKGDPVAVLISWITNHGDGLDSTRTSTTAAPANAPPPVSTDVDHEGERTSRSGCLTEGGRAETDASNDVAVHDIERRNAVDGIRRPHTVAVIGHLTTGRLHDFLFGERSVRADKASAAGEPNRSSARETIHSQDQDREGLPATNVTSAPHTQGDGPRNTAGEDASVIHRYPRRSESAASAALAGGGYCLLQKFVQSGGVRNSTLRCQWAPSRSSHASNEGTIQLRNHTPRVDALSHHAAGDSACSRDGRVRHGDGDRVLDAVDFGGSSQNQPGAPSSVRCGFEGLSPTGKTPGSSRRTDDGELKQSCPNGFSSSLCLSGDRSLESSLDRTLGFYRLPERPLIESKRGNRAFLRPSPSSFVQRELLPRSQGRSTSSTPALSTGKGSPWNGTTTSEVELGRVERVPCSRKARVQCLLERCTNVYRAARGDLSCEDRCVTFEEPPPSGRMGLWPRSTREAVKSPALRHSIIEACNTVADHVRQVTKASFRPMGLTSYFRQGQDGRTYLMFVSQWGNSSSFDVDSCESLLLRTPGEETCSLLVPTQQHHNEQEKTNAKTCPFEPTTGGRRGHKAIRQPSTAILAGSDPTKRGEVKNYVDHATQDGEGGLGRSCSDTGETVIIATASRSTCSLFANGRATSSYIMANGASLTFSCPGCGSTGAGDSLRLGRNTEASNTGIRPETRPRGQSSGADEGHGVRRQYQLSVVDTGQDARWQHHKSLNVDRHQESRRQSQTSSGDQVPEARRKGQESQGQDAGRQDRALSTDQVQDIGRQDQASSADKGQDGARQDQVRNSAPVVLEDVEETARSCSETPESSSAKNITATATTTTCSTLTTIPTNTNTNTNTTATTTATATTAAVTVTTTPATATIPDGVTTTTTVGYATVDATIPMDGKYYTSLGVVVDACSGNRQRPDHTADNGDSCQGAASGRTHSVDLGINTSVGIAKCLRILAQLYPGVSTDRAAQRCAEDTRLRLRGVRVCRGCAVDISHASDERLRETDRVARVRAHTLGQQLGRVPHQPRSKRQQEARLAEDIKAFQQRMNTSATRVQPHAVFRGGPNRVVDASKGGPTDSGWRNSVGITRARAAKAGSRNRVGSTKEGAYNSSFSRNSVGVTEERAAYSGSRDRLNVTRGRASDSGFRNFPSRPNEPGVAVAGAQRGKTRPSTAGGASSSRRQPYKYSSRRIVSARAPARADWSGGGELSTTQTQKLRDQGTSKSNGRVEAFGGDRRGEDHAQELGGFCTDSAAAGSGGEQKSFHASHKVVDDDADDGLLTDASRQHMDTSVGDEQDITVVPSNGRLQQAAGTGCDKDPSFNGGETGAVTHGENSSSSVSMDDRTVSVAVNGCNSTPQPRRQLSLTGLPKQKDSRGATASRHKQATMTPAHLRARLSPAAQRIQTDSRGLITSRNEQHTVTQNGCRQQSQSPRRNLGGVEVPGGAWRSFYARSEVALRRQQLGSIYGGPKGERSPRGANVRADKHCYKRTPGKNQMGRRRLQSAPRRRREASERGERDPSESSPRRSTDYVQAAKKTSAPKTSVLRKNNGGDGRKSTASIPHEAGEGSRVKFVGGASGSGASGVSWAGGKSCAMDDSMGASSVLHIGVSSGGVGVSDAGGSCLAGDGVGREGQDATGVDGVVDDDGRCAADAQSVTEGSGIDSGDENGSPILNDPDVASRSSSEYSENSVESLSSSVFVETGHGSE